VWIHLAVHKIIANKTFIVTDGLISWLFVIAFVYLTYVQIAVIRRECGQTLGRVRVRTIVNY